ncbi:MAG: acyltransferase family protein [Phocaeicola sp.]|uniref:acyltransferase family protein n=1 Tax=Phocaeicola TaxID=909656 RepID=UPI00234F2ADD|nr:acyltransferase [Phocaeicola oris]MCE2616330.1 acyltransferase [Phocaeicola oris]
MSDISSASFSDSKPHYELLDGLRGVAALLVLWYHVNEGYGFAESVNGVSDGLIKVFNHGYLAVDFFFILSGFVIGYAYDDRWKKGFTKKNFFKRRLIRLHPMVVLGAVLGLITFCLQGNIQWDGTHVATSSVMLAVLCGMFLIPATPGGSYEVRGNGEMYPLNGPFWSLFFEYIGNILYGIFIHKLSTKILAGLTFILGVILIWFTTLDISHYGSLGIGWTLDTVNFFGGALRMLFPYSMGMLLSRIFHPIKVNGTFWICSLVLLLLFCVPFISAMEPFCMNGLFESFCIIIVFPALVWLGASGTTTDKKSTGICKFLGDISYPLYMVHYPFMYLFYSWLIKNEYYTFGQSWEMSVIVMIWNILLAYTSLKLYDEPVRKYLAKRFINKKR